MTHPKAIPNHVVEAKSITLREAQRKLFSAVCIEKAGLIFSGLEKSSELLENRIEQHCCCLWVRAGGKERQVRERAHEEMPAKSQQRLLLQSSFCSSGDLRAACGESRSAPLNIWWIMALESTFVTQSCSPCASLQLCSALVATAAAPVFYTAFEAKQNVSVAEDGTRILV